VEVPKDVADASRLESLAVRLGGPTIDAMSTSDAASEWELTVPGDDAELSAEFRHRGVRPGQRVHEDEADQ
jgi:hypothetical protein